MKATKSRKIPKKKAPTFMEKIYERGKEKTREEQRLSSKIPPEVEAKLEQQKMFELYSSALREIEALEHVVQKYRDLFPNFLPMKGGVYMQASKYKKIKEFDGGWIPIPKFEKPIFKNSQGKPIKGY